MSFFDDRKAKLSLSGSKMLFMLLVVGMTLFGLVMVYSASAPSAVAEGSDIFASLRSQAFYAVIGGAFAVVLYRFDYRSWLSRLVYPIWFVCLVLVVLTMFLGAGSSDWGAQRWLVLGPISMQPSEFMKVALVLVATRIMIQFHEGEFEDMKSLMGNVLLYVLMPIGLIFITQSDLGTTAIIIVGMVAVMYLGEVPSKIIGAVVIVIIALGFLGVAIAPYRAARLSIFLDPWNDGSNGYGNGYQIIQSIYAFSQGGLFGLGIGNSTQKYLYLPESDTDFIFSVIGEETGMLGALLVIAAFLALIYAGMEIARNSVDEGGTMLAGSLTVMIGFQAFLNMGSALSVFPMTGKPLPFISAGGSSLIATFAMVGLILSVARVAEDDSAPSVSRGRDIYEQRRDNLRVVRATDRDDANAGFDAGFAGSARGTGRGSGSRGASRATDRGVSSPSRSSRSSSRGGSARTRR